jgi:hypothetical protein
MPQHDGNNYFYHPFYIIELSTQLTSEQSDSIAEEDLLWKDDLGAGAVKYTPPCSKMLAALPRQVELCWENVEAGRNKNPQSCKEQAFYAQKLATNCTAEHDEVRELGMFDKVVIVSLNPLECV